MPPLRTPISLPHLLRYTGQSIARQPPITRNLSLTPSRSVQGYGDGEGHPMGEKPQEQGGSNETKQNLEHPGPAPPAEGQGKGAGPTKGRSKTKKEAAKSGPGSKETCSSPTSGSAGKNGDKRSSPQDKEGEAEHATKGGSWEGSNNVDKTEVDKHNKEFEEGYDRAPKAPGTKEVDSKGRWTD